MSEWQPELDEIARRREIAERMGGEEKVARQHGRGKSDARQRIAALVDDDSFHEIGVLAAKSRYVDGELVDVVPANFITGTARIEGRKVVLGVDDFTVRGGASDGAIVDKQVYSEQMAGELRLPLVRMLDGTGGGGSIRSLEEMGRSYVPMLPGFEFAIDNLSVVPVVALGLGPVAGFGAARLVTSHYSVMVRGLSQTFVAGPPVVAGVGETVTKEELGGVDVHGPNGTVDAIVESEEEAFASARRFLSYLPPSVDEVPERGPVTDDPGRADDWLADAIPRDPRQVYRIRPIIESLVDRGSFFEIGASYGRSLVTGFARLDGWPVAIMAGDPYIYGGSWTETSAAKAVRFVDLADTFHLPLVNLVDNPGFMIGTAGERAGAIRHGMRALTAIYQARIPWCSVLLRKVYGVGGAGQSHHRRLQRRFAWPSAQWGSLPSSGGIEAAYRAEIEAADDPDEFIRAKQDEVAALMSPFRTAEAFDIQDIVDPRETRSLLCVFAADSAKLRQPGRTARGLRP
ncbi:propionyl-CoA carboxylase subunit beta [Aeromicrobium panaciterrae]|uniref:acyl-CoA carboxylase subunit beta n=1 Tax=Aeromicrobium panaciterrae TaxID=363861 RepID=UPI0031E0F927